MVVAVSMIGVGWLFQDSESPGGCALVGIPVTCCSV